MTDFPHVVCLLCNCFDIITYTVITQQLINAGKVMYANIKTDNGKSRGFGNVRFETPDQAQAAVRHFNGIDMEGRKIDVQIDNRG